MPRSNLANGIDFRDTHLQRMRHLADAGLEIFVIRTIHVRDSKENDDCAVGELLVRSYQTHYARKLPDVVLLPERLADLRNQAGKRANASVIVFECEGSLAGTVTIYPAGISQSEAWIDNAADLRYLAVDIDYQGKGMSQAVLDEAERRARTWKVSAICLHVRQGAEGVARLYQSRGYVRDDSGDIDRRPVIYLAAYVLYL